MALGRLHAGESEAARAAVRDARLAAAALEKHVRRVEVAEEGGQLSKMKARSSLSPEKRQPPAGFSG